MYHFSKRPFLQWLRTKAPSISPIPLSQSPYEDIRQLALKWKQKNPYECPQCGIPAYSTKKQFLEINHCHSQYCNSLMQWNMDMHDLRSTRAKPEFECYPDYTKDGSPINMEGWKEYLNSRGFENVKGNERGIRYLSKLFTYPLTLACGLRQCNMLNHDEIKIAIIGPRSEAALPDRIWKELHYIYPHIKMMRLLLIGPDVQDHLHMTTKHIATNLVIEYFKGTYHRIHDLDGNSFMADLFVSFNSGVGHMAYRYHWTPTLLQILVNDRPIILTSFNEQDQKNDLLYLKQLENQFQLNLDYFLPVQQNVFRSIQPEVDVDNSNHVIYSNWGLVGFKNKK